MNDEFAQVMPRLALALGIGLLIGVERGWRTRDAEPGSRTAGVRTFAITGLLGGVIGALARGPDGVSDGGFVLIGLAFVAYAAVVSLFAREENRATRVFSATTTIAGLLTFVLGIYAPLGDVRVAAATAVAATGILLIREELHSWVQKLSAAELQSVLVLLAMSFIALPVMPDRDIGPWGGINPRDVWIIAITLAGISFAGFVAEKSLGERRGVLIASAIGGTISSTAVMVANARAAAAQPANARLLAAGSALATAVSFVRVTAISLVIAPALALNLAPPLIAGTVVAAGLAWFFASGRDAEITRTAETKMQFQNPFGFFAVVGLALMMGGLMLIMRIVNARFGTSGASLGATLAGLLDVDAMTVSVSQLVPARLDASSAALAIFAGVVSNNVFKSVFAAIVGRGRFARLVAVLLLSCVASGALILVLMTTLAD